MSGDRCPRCGGGFPFDHDDPDLVCHCGLDWARIAPFPRRHLDGDEWRYVRHLLAIRAGHRCEGCGLPFQAGRSEPNAHHRLDSDMGGNRRANFNSLANLVLLCAGPNARLGGAAPGCHSRADTDRGWSEPRGLVLRHGQAPETEPLVLHSGRRVLLDPVSPFYLPAPGPVYAL